MEIFDKEDFWLIGRGFHRWTLEENWKASVETETRAPTTITQKYFGLNILAMTH